MVKQAARQFYRLGEVYRPVYRHRESGESGHKLIVSTCVASKIRPVNHLSLSRR